MSKKFGFLRFIAGLYKVIGIILFVIGILAALGVLVSGFFGGAAMESLTSELDFSGGGLLGGILGGIIGSIMVLISFGLAGIAQIAISEGIHVFLSIEENTRATAALLTRPE